MANSQGTDEKLLRYEQALKDIVEPVGYLYRTLPEGYKLDGLAVVRACDGPSLYQRIAREALGEQS